MFDFMVGLFGRVEIQVQTWSLVPSSFGNDYVTGEVLPIELVMERRGG